MLKKLLLTTLSIAAFSAAASVNAATYNFVDLTDTVGEGTWSAKSGTGPISAGGVWEVDSIGVSASAETATALTGLDGFSTSAQAYLDGRSSTRPAGLGVCSLTNCAGSSDDNAGIAGDVTGSNYETLILTFTTSVSLDSLSFNDRDHYAHTDDFQLKINGVTWTLGQSLDGIAASNAYEFERIGGTRITRDFYLASAEVTAVPIPAAAWLFGSALIGLAGVARKRKLS